VSSGIVEPQDPNEGQTTTVAQQGISRSRLVQRLLAASASLPKFLEDLLKLQAVTVTGTEAAAFLIERVDEGKVALRPVAHIRPDESSPETRAAALAAFQEIIQPCVAQSKDGAVQVTQDEPEAQYCLVTLLRAEGEIVAVSAVITRCRDLERAQQRLQSMLLVAGYFELYMLKRTIDQSKSIAQSHQHVLQLATSVATADGFSSAAMNLCNEMANRTGASRVAIGWVKGERVRVKALSHTEEFDKKQELIVQLERVMDECLDQDEVVQFETDGTSSQNVTREAQALSRGQGGNAVISIPLRRKADIIGVLTLEFGQGQKLGPQASTGLSVAADLLAPQLYDRYQNDRWLITKTGISIREGVKTVIGPKYWIPKICVAVGIIALLLICDLVPLVDLRVPYRVQAHFQFDPIERRFIHAPFDGFIDQVVARPGDRVEAGKTVLFTLNTDELRHQLAKAKYQAVEAEKQRVKFLNDTPRKVAEAGVAAEQKKEAEAEVALYEYQISRATVKAELDGYVLEGDLKDKIGAPVKQADQLMVIGQKDKLKGVLRVAERNIQDVKKDYKGTLATTSLPAYAGPVAMMSRHSYPFTVERVVPNTEAKEGENYFKVYVAIQDAAPDWLPGMEGEARIDVTRKSVGWIWTHPILDWQILSLWSNPMTSPFTK
jgi:hypothetical protein